MKEFENSFNKAKVKLLTCKQTFIASVFIMLKQEITDSIPTAATDGKCIKINPEFFMSLTSDERVFLLAHEAWHTVLQHVLSDRKGNRDPLIWNKAGDYVINLILVKAGLKMPDGGLLEYAYDGLSTEQVYDLLIENQDESEDSFGNDVEINKEITEEEIKEVISRGITLAQKDNTYGDLPENIKREFDRFLNPKLPWNIILQNFLYEIAKEDYSWKKPNRRLFPQYYLPSVYSEGLTNITVAIDTSGSITDKQLSEILTEVIAIHETFKPKKLTVLSCDYSIHEIHEIDEYTDIHSLSFSGGGGTRCEPVLEYCEQEGSNVLLYFTDLEMYIPEEEVPFNLFWICYSKQPAPKIGTTIYYE